MQDKTKSRVKNKGDPKDKIEIQQKSKIKETPSISVVICAYNAAHCIGGILHSLQQQTFTNFEIVVVNDGSTDATSSVAARAGAQVVDMPHQGLSAARNVGITSAKAPIVAIIDAD